MRKNPHQRHAKLKHIPHTSEHKNEDGTPNLAAMAAFAPELLAAIQSGNPQLLDMDMTDPDPVTGEYYTIFRMKAK